MTDGPDGPGAHGGQPAPEHRPGIVALRPLDLGDVLGGALRYVRAHPVAVLVPALVFTLVVGAVQVAVQIAVVGADPPPFGFFDALSVSLVVSWPILVATFVLYPPLAAVQFTVLVPAVTGRRLTPGAAWSAARRRLPLVYGVYLALMLVNLVVLGVPLGAAVLLDQAGSTAAAWILLLAGYVLAISVGVRLFPSVPVAVVEGLDVRSSLERSWSLVRGAWWRFFGFQFVAGLLGYLAMLVVVVPATIVAVLVLLSSGETVAATGALPWSFIAIIGVPTVLAVTVLLAFLTGVLGLLYVDQRIRRERWDQELSG